MSPLFNPFGLEMSRQAAELVAKETPCTDMKGIIARIGGPEQLTDGMLQTLLDMVGGADPKDQAYVPGFSVGGITRGRGLGEK